MKRLLVALLFAGVPFAQNIGNQTPPPAYKMSPIAGSPVTAAKPARDPLAFTGGAHIDALIHHAIKRGQIPGAVVVVGHEGRIVHRKAYGSRALIPAREPMTLDTIFDIASLTKVVATTSSIMKLVEMGEVRLNDPVTEYIPEYQGGGHNEITVRQLLTHYSGLRPDVDLIPAWSGYDTGIRLAISDRPTGVPNTRFLYSDINFLLLGEIVKRASGLPLPEFARKHVFEPLGMEETMYQPPPRILSRIAPTELLPGHSEPLRGVVHDPTTRYMGGVAGHAGLFSTAADLTRFAEMMLRLGEVGDKRIFSPLTVRTFTSPQSPSGQTALRGLGWDIDSPFSGPRGDLFPIGSYGHTGFTGTSLWIDPSTRSFVLMLTNAVHPKLKPTITPLRGRIASAAAAGLNIAPLPTTPAVLAYMSQAAPKTIPRTASLLTGIDVLESQKFAALQGKRVGLITNHTGLTRDGRRTIDAMIAGGVNLKALYSPEHGLAGREDHENVANAKDSVTGLPVWSLYVGGNRRPSSEMLGGIDVLVFDIQDVGARFYTYVCTMVYAMEEAAKRKIEYIVLDRPNPITGVKVEGPMLDPSLRSFIGCIDMPLRHGMTVGELALFVNDSAPVKANLKVIAMKDWHRGDWFDTTGLTWVDLSPNMRSLNAALLYPGIGMLEHSRVYSVGRGTDAPFEQIGADWIRGRELAAYLNGRGIPGIRVYPTQFKPTSSNFAGKMIQGVRFIITDRDAFHSTRFGLELGSALERLFPGKMTWAVNDKLIGDRQTLAGMQRASEPAQIEAGYSAALAAFLQARQRFLLYQ
ncbi:MAG TPA: exo-beta-N-acetylmuramidase NamZ domain-containing protein [Bryobacteraceae bacterium]|nr:exo-beta-N-acetylmuramidase NamZ domain-containing protein [Bryobacteraceae bacterium]